MTTPAPQVLAHDRGGPAGAPSVLLVHAAVADRRMWGPVWAALTRSYGCVRVDLRGFGDSTDRPAGALDHVSDLLGVLDACGLERVHVVAASVGAGVAVELALTAPDRVASLLLAGPGGCLIESRTPQLSAFVEQEDTALEAGDLDAAAEANVRWWVVGPERDESVVPRDVRRLVHDMQRRAFEITADWDDIDEMELDPPALDRLGEVAAPTMVLLGGHDLDAIAIAAARVADGVPGARLLTWPDVAHLPSLERPDRFLALIRGWLDELSAVG